MPWGWGNAAYRRFKKVRYVRMPELLDELSIARSGGELKKCLAPTRRWTCWKLWRPVAKFEF